jgi:hypothetical protein
MHPGPESQSAQNKSIGMVKVQWTYYGPEDATWEHEETMWEEYPQFFPILKKIEVENARLHFWAASYQNHISEILGRLC